MDPNTLSTTMTEPAEFIKARERAAVMLAFAEGKKIQCQRKGGGQPFVTTSGPTWNWDHYDYRIEPPPPPAEPREDVVVKLAESILTALREGGTEPRSNAFSYIYPVLEKAMRGACEKASALIAAEKRQTEGAWTNRNHFCEHINLIAKEVLGWKHDSVSPEAVSREVKTLVDGLKEEISRVNEVQPGQGGEGLNYVLRMVQAYATRLDGTGDEIGAKQIRANLDRYYGAYMSGEPEQSPPASGDALPTYREVLSAVVMDLEMELNNRGITGEKWCSLVEARRVLADLPEAPFRYFKDADGSRWKMPTDDSKGYYLSKRGWIDQPTNLSGILADMERDGTVETDEHGSPLVKAQYSQQIDAVIYSTLTNGFTQEDWLALAAAATDQAS